MGSETGSNDDLTDWTRDSPNTAKQPSSSSYQLKDSSSSRRKSAAVPYASSAEEDFEEDCWCCPVDPVLCWFRFFHTISGLIGVATLAANLFVLITIDTKSINAKDIIMRCYAIIFCFIIILTGALKVQQGPCTVFHTLHSTKHLIIHSQQFVTDVKNFFCEKEIDWRYVMKRIRILDLWFFRGLFYFYVGFITIENDTTFTQPQDIIGLTQISMGACYVFMVSCSRIYEHVKVPARYTMC